jgi:protein arginine kinase
MMPEESKSEDVVLSSRVRLARNHADLPFPNAMEDEDAQESIRRSADALEPRKMRLLRMAQIPFIQRQVLVERHLISLDLIEEPMNAAVLLQDDESVSIMLNEEDHLRIQAIQKGFALEEAARLAFEADDALSEVLHYAFDNNLGYLTACPTNTGTGMRASAMLHLPALTWSGEMTKVSQAVAKLGLTMRGLYGEGSEAQGDIYQISNQVTLGRTEKEILDAIAAVVGQMIDWERKVRVALHSGDKLELEDRLFRALGIMERAQQMNAKEFMQRWSCLRMGACMNLMKLDVDMLDRLLVMAQPASLQQAAGEALETEERDQRRAALIHSMLGDSARV